MPQTTARLPRRHKVLKIIGLAFLAFIVLFIATGLWVYRTSVKTFEVRRLSLPTRIYADYTPLKPGVPLSADDLAEKLDRLGYRKSDSLAQTGDYVTGRGEVDVYTREFSHPSGRYPSQPVRVAFSGATVGSVVSLKESGNVENAALEPELLTSILSEQLENRRPVTLD